MSVSGQAWPLPAYGANPQSSSNGSPLARVGQNLILLLAILSTLANCYRAWHIVGVVLGLVVSNLESGIRRGRLLDCACVGGLPTKGEWRREFQDTQTCNCNFCHSSLTKRPFSLDILASSNVSWVAPEAPYQEAHGAGHRGHLPTATQVGSEGPPALPAA